MFDEYPCTVPYDPETRSEWRVLRVPTAEYTERLRQVRSRMSANGIPALLVAGTPAEPANIQYLTNYRPLAGTTLLLITEDNDPVVLTDAILHGEPMHSMLWDVIFDDLRPCEPDDLVKHTVAAIHELGVDQIGIASPTALAMQLARELQSGLDGLEFIDGSPVLLAARAIKSPAEIANLRTACRITREALEAAIDACRPGATEREVATVIQSTIMQGGADGLAFETTVASGPRAGLKHAAPTERQLESGDMVFLDAGALINGYHADLSRVGTVGQPDIEVEMLLDTAAEMFRQTLNKVKPGAPVRDLYRAAERVARRAGLLADYMAGGIGHGVGLSIFEQPSLAPGDDQVLEAGMTFALEPMLVRYGVGTAVVEETVLVTDDGYEILSGAEW